MCWCQNLEKFAGFKVVGRGCQPQLPLPSVYKWAIVAVESALLVLEVHQAEAVHLNRMMIGGLCVGIQVEVDKDLELLCDIFQNSGIGVETI